MKLNGAYMLRCFVLSSNFKGKGSLTPLSVSFLETLQALHTHQPAIILLGLLNNMLFGVKSISEINQFIALHICD